jgi:predicted ferric reductase
VRAVLTLGAYALLVLAPLFAAALADPVTGSRPWNVEFSAATGLLAVGVLALEFALVARLKPVNAPFGSDGLMLFHREMGIAGLVLVGVHVATSADPAAVLGLHGGAALRAGALAGAALLAIVLLSLARKRMQVRYERWLFGHRLLAAVLLPTMLLHAVGAGEYAKSSAVRALLLVHGAIVALVALDYRVRRPLAEQRRPWTVTGARTERGGVHCVTLRPDGHDGLQFAPGQFVWLRTSPRWWSPQEHPISIASSSERQEIELAIAARGDWSKRCAQELQPGAHVWLDGPFGAFSPDRVSAERFLFIGGGTGIAPLRSMLLSLRDRGDKRPILLVHAARSREYETFRDELRALTAKLDLQIVSVHEECDRADACEIGRVTRELLERCLQGKVERTHAFVCGPPPLLDQMEHTLLSLGFRSAQIHTERFDMV